MHYGVAKIPGAGQKTAAEARNNATLPVIRKLASKGIHSALAENKHLLNGLNVCKGKLARPEVAADLDLEFTEAEEAIKTIV